MSTASSTTPRRSWTARCAPPTPSTGGRRTWNSITGQTKQEDAALEQSAAEGAPTAEQLNTLFVNVKDGLPQTLANVEIIVEMLKRYNKGVEQALVLLPQAAAAGQSVAAPYPGEAALDLGLSINQPAPASPASCRPANGGPRRTSA